MVDKFGIIRDNVWRSWILKFYIEILENLGILTANYYWVKQREFRQRFAFRKYETFTGHLNFIWETPLEGFKVSISGGRYLAKDSGITLNCLKHLNQDLLLVLLLLKQIFLQKNLVKEVLIKEFIFQFL